jgi:hypothetical protein
MKKIMLFVVGLAVLSSCREESNVVSTKTAEIGKYSIVEIDGCEYIEFDNGIGSGRVHTLVHKGNCFNHGYIK